MKIHVFFLLISNLLKNKIILISKTQIYMNIIYLYIYLYYEI